NPSIHRVLQALILPSLCLHQFSYDSSARLIYRYMHTYLLRYLRLKYRLLTVPPLCRSLIQVRLHIAQAGHTLSSAHMVRPCRSPTSCRQSVPDFSPAVLPAQTPCAPEPPAPDSESAHPTVRAVWKAPIYPHLISS